MLTAPLYILVVALIGGALGALLVDAIIRRLWWWTSRSLRSDIAATRAAIKRDRKARRLHFARSWVGQARSDGDPDAS